LTICFVTASQKDQHPDVTQAPELLGDSLNKRETLFTEASEAF